MAENNEQVSLNHIADIYLYEYYIAADKSYDLISDETCKKYIENGRRLTNEGNYNEAINEFSKALEYNPVNVAVINKIVSCYKYLHDIEKEFEYAQKTYNFCCTRSELATYYRNVGWYYLEKYKPEVSVACYMYSNLFEKSEQNENEIHFLEVATQKSYKDLSIEEIQETLKENSIPIEASSVTLALMYRAGLEALSLGNKTQAYECFFMVYDLTQDEEVKELMERSRL